MKTKYLWLLLLLGLILRLIIVFWSINFPQNPDLLRHRDWGKITYLYGIDKTYNAKYLSYGDKPNNLPPGSTFIITGAYSTSIFVSKIFLKLFHLQEGTNIFLNIYLVDFFLKLPAIISDLIIAVFIYLIVKFYKKQKTAILSAGFFLFNPVVIYNSALWGQIDSLNNAVFIISLFFLLKKQIFLSVFFCFLSFYFKLSLLPFFPFYLFFMYLFKINSAKLGKYLLVSITILVFFTTLFFPNVFQWPDFFIFNNFKQEANLITVNAFNFWYFILLPLYPSGNFPKLFPLLNYSAYLLFFLSCLPMLAIIIKNKNKFKTELIFFSFSLLSLLMFLFIPRMHERYLYPLFPLLAVAVGFNKKFLFLYFLFSLLHLLNLLFVWHPIFSGIFSIIITNLWLGWVVSLGIIITGIFLYKKVFKTF